MVRTLHRGNKNVLEALGRESPAKIMKREKRSVYGIYGM
jgi:hypothetical protein